MEKMTYVSNTIGIPINRVDLCHHGLQIGERSPKSSMKLSQCEERERKKEKEGEER
jgi:hypothetical protein